MSAPPYATGHHPQAIPLPWWLKELSGLPLWFLYALTATLVWLMRRVVRYRLHTVRTNIARSFPQLPVRRRRLIESAYYTNLSQVLAEVIKMAALSQQELQQRVRFSNPHLILTVIDSGHSALLVCAHQCNWEWQLLALSAQLQVPVQAAYKPPRGRRAERLMRTLRSRFGAELVPAKELLASLLRRRDARAIAMVADQSPVSSDLRHWTGFLGQTTAFYMGPEKIARATRFAVIFTTMRRIARGRYEVECELLALWSHRRWKLPEAS